MKRRSGCCALIFLFGLIGSPVIAEEMKYPLTVTVSGAKPGTGQAVLSLFSSPDNYLKTPLIKETRPIDGSGRVTFILEPLDPGIYAVSIVYDEDGNGKLNTGFLGIPTEMVGFSNNAKGTFGPPSFTETSFTLSSPHTIEVILGKAKK